MEFVVGRAIYALTATTTIAEADFELAAQKWMKTLDGCLIDPLGGLIPRLDIALKEHDVPITDEEAKLIEALKSSKGIRDAVCHSAWAEVDEAGLPLPFFVNRKMEKLETPMDLGFLQRQQQHVAELVCLVVSTVTSRGIRFPGTASPGRPVSQRVGALNRCI